MINDSYTLEDHEARESDPYAAAKYALTLRWLRSESISGSLLNIGCGGGVFNELAYNAGYQVTGIEPDPAACKLADDVARGKYRVSNQGLFDDLGPSASEAIVMHDVLEHIESEPDSVAALVRLMVPGSVLVISVPAMEWLFGYHDRQLGHYRRYTKRTLRRTLTKEFEIEKIRYIGLVMIPIALWYSRIRNKPYPVNAVSNGILSRILRFVCMLESRIPGPVGTSVVALARLRVVDSAL